MKNLRLVKKTSEFGKMLKHSVQYAEEDDIILYDNNKIETPTYIDNNGFEYVDLGLPSGTLWAKCNVGAETELDAGNYFAWAETEDRTNNISYNFKDTKYCEGDTTSEDNITKYNKVDNLIVLELDDDAVHVNMGGDWVMPTKDLTQELYDECDHSFVEDYQNKGVSGILFTSKHNGNTMFCPKTGYYNGSSYYGTSYSYRMWTSSIGTKCTHAIGMDCYTSSIYIRDNYRFYGMTTRGVILKK